MSATGRWYERGLRFACTGCGRCCTGGDGYVWVAREEICALAERFGLSLDEFGKRFLRRVGTRYALVDSADGDCVFLVGKVCSVYEDRPSQCRAFPWWPSNLASPAAWRLAAESCEGISDDAPVVAADTIEGHTKTCGDAGAQRHLIPPDAVEAPANCRDHRADGDANAPIDSSWRPPHVAES